MAVPSFLTPATDRREVAIGLICAAIVVCLWSGFLLISRFGLSSGTLSPYDFGFLRYAVSGVIMAPVLWYLGFAGLSIPRAFVLAATAGLGFGMFAYFGFARAPAAHAAVLLPGSLPFYTALLSVVVLGQRLTTRQTVALTLILTGIVCLGASSLAGFDWRQFRGDLLFACGSFSWAIFTICIRLWRVEPIRAAAMVCVGAAIVYLPIWALFLPKTLHLASPGEILIQGFYQGFVATILALLLFARAVKALGPAITTMITAIVPGTVSLAAVPLLGEPLGLLSGLGVAFVTAGMVGTVLGLRQRAAATPKSA